MKQILSILFAVAILTACNKGTSEGTAGQSSGRVVYVNTDTLLTNYDYYKNVVTEFQSKQFAL